MTMSKNRIGHLNQVAQEIYKLDYKDLSDRECAIVAEKVRENEME